MAGGRHLRPFHFVVYVTRPAAAGGRSRSRSLPRAPAAPPTLSRLSDKQNISADAAIYEVLRSRNRVYGHITVLNISHIGPFLYDYLLNLPRLADGR
ncbi:hypothetical protein EVAR_42400_1 [Eumeta japonica]|uniref:Uncharacterized protein n=1 Tax=Eumeta variegata TaxID=151549 RepID=A0A4C1XB13_EUMVA|nr:hypothetical protein EVAR_42400_1 [Eumeta japonica]